MAEPLIPLEDEIWKPVVGYEGYYEVSNIGSVRSITRTISRRDGKTQTLKSKIPTILVSRGYKKVCLSKENTQKCKFIHRLVCQAFNGDGGDDKVVRHLNGNKDDNRDINLRWGTDKENYEDLVSHGSEVLGERRGKFVITAADVLEVRRLHGLGYSAAGLARTYCVSRGAVRAIISNRTWKHLGSQDNCVNTER